MLTNFSMAGRLIISVTYGIDVLPSEDPYIALVEAAVNALIAAALPGKFLVVGTETMESQ
jgi:hypothetical protein